MKRLNTGQKVKMQEDLQITGAILGKTETIKKGTELFVGANTFFHTLRGDKIRIDSANYEVTDGYSAEGLAEWIYRFLYSEYMHYFGDMFDELADLEDADTDREEERFKEIMIEALGELGFREAKENVQDGL